MMDEGNKTANCNNSNKEAIAKTPAAIKSEISSINTVRNDDAISKKCEDDDSTDESNNCDVGDSSINCASSMEKNECWPSNVQIPNVYAMQINREDNVTSSSNQCITTNPINFDTKLEQSNRNNKSINSSHTPTIFQNDTAQSIDTSVVENVPKAPCNPLEMQPFLKAQNYGSLLHMPTADVHMRLTAVHFVHDITRAQGEQTCRLSHDERESNPSYRNTANLLVEIGNGKQPSIESSLYLANEDSHLPTTEHSRAVNANSLGKNEGVKPHTGDEAVVANEQQLPDLVPTSHKNGHEEEKRRGKDELTVPRNTASDVEEGRDVTSKITKRSQKDDLKTQELQTHSSHHNLQRSSHPTSSTEHQAQDLPHVNSPVDYVTHQFGNNFNDSNTQLDIPADSFQRTFDQVTSDEASDKNDSQTGTAPDARSEVTSQDDGQQGHGDRNQDSMHCFTNHENLVLLSGRSSEEKESISSNGDLNEAPTLGGRGSPQGPAISRIPESAVRGEVLTDPPYEEESACASEGFDTDMRPTTELDAALVGAESLQQESDNARGGAYTEMESCCIAVQPRTPSPFWATSDIGSRTGYDNATTQDAALAGAERLQVESDNAGNGAHTETESYCRTCSAVQPRTPSPFWATSGENTIPRIVGIYQVLQPSANSIESSNRHSRRRSERHYAMSPVQASISLHDIVRDIHEPALMSDGHANRNSHYSFCLVCIQQPVEVVLSCGHIVTCRECARDLPFGCPLCQAPLQYFIPLCLQLME